MKRKLIVTLLVAGGILILVSTLQPLLAELPKPQPQDRYVARLVVMLMSRDHYARQPLNDEISRRTVDSFLNKIDPSKMYFDQSDIDEFLVHREEIDDRLGRGDVSFAKHER